jgi:hypothetical protein
MTKAVDLLYQGRYAEIWQMCCGYLLLDTDRFMGLQKRLLLGQIDLLNHSGIGKKIMGSSFPTSVDEFRKSVPLTTYRDYTPELVEKREDLLTEKPVMWVHTSGRTGEYPCKWIPISQSYIDKIGPILYGIGLLSASSHWGDKTPFTKYPRFIYTVAPRPYMSGALASMLQNQTPHKYYPSMSRAENVPFENRIQMGFEEALEGGLDYFFGLSLVLSAVGEKFSNSANSVNLGHFISKPKAMMRLTSGTLKSRLAKRNLLPKDLWNIKGIITSGLDSSVYREKINEYWGRYPLDIYSSTEGGVMATQTWDYQGMSFVPNLNFFEFIPEKEHLKSRIDRNYKPTTVLLDEVEAGECYEIVITSLCGGALIRYRIGDIIRITSLRNEVLGINIPQMVFERRADDLLDFAAIRLNEKAIWQAIERTGIAYQGWVAYKKPGEMVLNILLETGDGYDINKLEYEKELYRQILMTDSEVYSNMKEQDDLNNMIRFKLNLDLLPHGAFARYSAKRKMEGADIAHLKPPHINPSQKVLASLVESPVSFIETKIKVSEQTNNISIG